MEKDELVKENDKLRDEKLGLFTALDAAKNQKDQTNAKLANADQGLRRDFMVMLDKPVYEATRDPFTRSREVPLLSWHQIFFLIGEMKELDENFKLKDKLIKAERRHAELDSEIRCLKANSERRQ